MRCARIGCATAVVALSWTGSLRAEETLRPRWELGAGVGALTMPAYRGSDEQHGYLFPVPYVVYRGEVLKVDREVVSGLLFKSERLELDVSLNGSAPVKSEDNRAREGMPDLAATLELGPQLDVLLLKGDDYRFELDLTVRSVVTVDSSGVGTAGWVASSSLNFDVKDVGPGGGWEVWLTGGLLWGDARVHGYYYGVPPEYATDDRPAYQASGGYSGGQATLGVSKRFPRFWAGAFVRANLLQGVVFEDSPLFKERVGYLAGIVVSAVLAQSGELVLSEE